MNAENKGNKNKQLLLFCAVTLVLAQVLTWIAPKEDGSDAWSYHYYSGAMLLDNRLNADYFAASSQSYFNPLVHAPFAAMVKAGWPDRAVAAVMAFYSSLALVLVAVLYSRSLGLRGWSLLAAWGMSWCSLVVLFCIGTSTADLFLQIPVLLTLLCLLRKEGGASRWQLCGAGFFLGAALGLKLSSVIYVPGFAVVLLWQWRRRHISFGGILISIVGGIAGFFLLYGWWALALYRQFDNPFFPFFNEWFRSQDFPIEPLVNKRFIAASWLDQILLPFRMSLSDAFTYVEFRAPDIRPGVFVLSVGLLLIARYVPKMAGKKLTENEQEFLLFLAISLVSWVLLSGNGRYAVGILVLLGGGILLTLRAAFPLPWFRSAFLLVLLLQVFVISQQAAWGSSPYRTRGTAWGGQWFNVDFSKVLGEGNLLLLTGTRSSLSVVEKDMGGNSSLINVSGMFSLDNNKKIQGKISQYKGRILGMVMSGPVVAMNSSWIKKVYFEQFSRFGLRVSDSPVCRAVPKIELNGKVGANFLFCELIEDQSVAKQYARITEKARQYFSKIETICPSVFSPRMNAISLSDKTLSKYYANYEIDVYVAENEQVTAKKQWSMIFLPLGRVADAFTVSPEAWRAQHCEALRQVRALTKS